MKCFVPSCLLLLQGSILPPCFCGISILNVVSGSRDHTPEEPNLGKVLTFHLAQEVQHSMETADRLRFVQNIFFLRKPNTQEQRLKSDLNLYCKKNIYHKQNLVQF